MNKKSATVGFFAISIVLLLALASLLSSCKASPLIPYAVEIVPPGEVILPALPQVLAESNNVDSDFKEFKATSGDQRYLIPLRLSVAADSNRARAIMLESHDGKRAIFQALIGPPALPSGLQKTSSTLYPIDRMVVRTLTSPQDPSLWRVTISSEPVSSQPYTFLLNIQIFGRDNIAGFKALLRGEAGFLLEARFALNTPANSRLELGIPVSLRHLSVTEQTM